MAEFHADKIKTNQFATPPGGPGMNQPESVEDFPEDKPGNKAVAAGMVALAVILLVSAIFLTSSGKSSLVSSLRFTYPSPNYEISTVKAPRGSLVHRDYVHKIYDGSRKCPSVGYVYIVHQKTGMEFERVLCKAGGGWEPTYYQRLLDEAAVRHLDAMESGYQNYGFGFGNMVEQMVGQEASNRAELYNRIPEVFNEEEMLRTAVIPALSMLTRGGDFSDLELFDDDESEGFESPDYDVIFYLAHAVVYPDQGAELYGAGLIREMP